MNLKHPAPNQQIKINKERKENRTNMKLINYLVKLA